jgi:hypothetical protein
MNRHTSPPAGPKGTEMNSARRAQAAVQQNHQALHPSLSARFSRRSRENLGREELASRNAFRAPGLAHTSAARTMMISRRLVGTLFLSWACATCLQAQESDPALTRRPASTPPTDTAKPATIPLSVPAGAPLQLALDEEVRIRKVGQPLHAHTVEPIYAFDKLVIPVGTAITGEITRIEPVSNGKRTLAALDADFTPAHAIDVTFTELILADGKRIPIHTVVTPGSGQVIQFLTAANEKEPQGVKDAAAEKAKEAKEEAKREWDAAMQQVKQPGKFHKAERYAVAQLPVHPQYIDAGTVYFAELQEPLDFGAEPLTPEMAASLGAAPPPGSFVRTLLRTPLNSASTAKGAPVEAILSQPLFDGTRLILPQGCRLRGSVVQVRPARYLSRNGQLRMVFHELLPPEGAGGEIVAQKVEANLEGVQAAATDNVSLDAEGGAQAGSPKSRYLLTTISIGLAAVSAGVGGDTLGDTTERAAGGAGGFKLIGIALGAGIHSQPFGMAMGALGAARSVYVHFIARGREVVFPKNTAMQIGIGTRQAAAPAASGGGAIQQ